MDRLYRELDSDTNYVSVKFICNRELRMDDDLAITDGSNIEVEHDEENNILYFNVFYCLLQNNRTENNRTVSSEQRTEPN
jgi:hypothetical protein